MKTGDLVRISPDLTHLQDWIEGKVIEIENTPYVGVVITAETSDGNIFFGYEYLFQKTQELSYEPLFKLD